MTKITEEEKGIIVKKYLNCETLDKISEEMRVSKGSVFNTVKAWKSEIGEDIVEEIRRFKMHLNQSNISINECIIGFRITNLLKQFDVFDEFERDYFDSVDDNRQLSSSNPHFNNNTLSPDLTDQQQQQQQQQQQIGKNYSSKQTNDKNDLYEFIGKIYQGCKNHDISPGDLVKWAKNLIEFAPRLDNKFDEIDNSSIVQDESQSPYKKQYSIPKVSELSTYIESEKRNYIILKKEISALINHKHELKNQINKKTEQLNELGKKENFTLQYLKWYSDLHDALINNYNIDIKQVYGTFVKVIYDFKKYDFDPIKIINDYKNMESLREEYNRYKRYNDIAIDNRNNLVQQVASLENQAFLYDRKIKNIEKLQNMGFGVKEFEQLSNVLMHIASVNKINKDTSVQKFLMDVASQYDCKLGFEATINLLNEEKER